ncbi:Pvc16 family protein [Photorhabdus sp. SF281]|uniref:Pvc16 family protein n=1 Tax=Photorhabdus sp. SF281 TaxID=3459527 RepID=UPI004044038C
MTRILNALINNRQLTGIPGAYTRVIPQQENLNILGNFWQALGNRPRLSLLYSISAPMKLQDIKDNMIPISQISTSVVQKPSMDNSQINQALTDKLCSELGGTEDVRLALAKVNLIAEPTTDNNYNQENESVILEVSGITRSTYLAKIEDIISIWVNSQKSVVKVNGVGIIIAKENSDSLISI